MAKLGKTASRLLDEAKARERVAVESYAGRGGGGGLAKGGRREMDAARALVDMGLLSIVSRHSSIIYANGYGCTVTSLVLAPVQQS